MIEYKYRTKGVCTREIFVRIENGILTGLDYGGGCDGNMQAVSRLAIGLPVEEVIAKLRGIDCEGRGTSCPDQLSKALEQALKIYCEGTA